MKLDQQKPRGNRFKNLDGKVFGRLTVRNFAGFNSRRTAHWNCQCSCGKLTVVAGANLNSGHTKSCGCAIREFTSRRLTTHGSTNTTEYRIWRAMISRCTLPSQISFAGYGARGIFVCDRWATSFQNFYSDMGPRPSVKHSIERMDNNKGYSPDNCIWGTPTQQSCNKRNNIRLTFKGETKVLSQWAREVKIADSSLMKRLTSGWTIEEALTTPTRAVRFTDAV